MSVARALVPAAVALLLTAIAVLSRPALLLDLDRAARDTFVRQTAPPAVGAGVAIVVVDEASLAAHGQWPWPRDTIARLVSALRDAGAASIAFDILFSEPDRLGLRLAGLRPDDLDRPAAGRCHRHGEGRRRLRADLRPGGPGRAAVVVRPAIPASRWCAQRTATSPVASLFAGTGAVCSVPALGRAAAASGALNASPDSDGVLRRVPLLVTLDGRIYPSLGLAAVHLAYPRHADTRSGRRRHAAPQARRRRGDPRRQGPTAGAAARPGTHLPAPLGRRRPGRADGAGHGDRSGRLRSAPPPSASATSWRRRSTPASPASRCTPPSPIPCSAPAPARGPSSPI